MLKNSRLEIRIILINIFLFILLVAVTIANIFLVYKGSLSASKIVFVLNNLQNADKAFESGSIVTPDEFRIISYWVWAIFASIIAGAGVTVASLVTQSLTKNILAEPSTLGVMQAGIFGLIVALSLNLTEYFLQFIFVIIAIAISLAILSWVIYSNKLNSASSRIILIGLAIGISFKIMTFLVRRGDIYLSSVSYSYTLGGSEEIVKAMGPKMWTTLTISGSLVLFSLVVFALIAKPLTIIDVNEEKAQQLGVNVRFVKFISVIVLLLAIPSSIIIAGNLAFLGLFSVQISRYLLKTRDFKKTFVLSTIIGATIFSSGLFLTNWVPRINSGLWMTFIGVPYIIYASIKRYR
jgi:iron complex transport system permease protein